MHSEAGRFPMPLWATRGPQEPQRVHHCQNHCSSRRSSLGAPGERTRANFRSSSGKRVEDDQKRVDPAVRPKIRAATSTRDQQACSRRSRLAFSLCSSPRPRALQWLQNARAADPKVPQRVHNGASEARDHFRIASASWMKSQNGSGSRSRLTSLERGATFRWLQDARAAYHKVVQRVHHGPTEVRDHFVIVSASCMKSSNGALSRGL